MMSRIDMLSVGVTVTDDPSWVPGSVITSSTFGAVVRSYSETVVAGGSIG